MLPADAIAHRLTAPPVTGYESHIVAIPDAMEYYDTVLRQRGWLVNIDSTTANPRRNGTYILQHFFCNPHSTPPAQISVIVQTYGFDPRYDVALMHALIYFGDMVPLAIPCGPPLAGVPPSTEPPFVDPPYAFPSSSP